MIRKELGEVDPQPHSPSTSPAVVKTLSESRTQAAVCGALGCRESPEAVVTHPDYGRRTLCSEHAERLVKKPPEGEQSGGRTASDSERSETAVLTPSERPERPEAGDPERSPATEGEPHVGPAGADLVTRWRSASRWWE